ncbi:hypothetical protein GF407_01380 [candidate division KSB1 bacterium]|nr:hypothetical protein [candidate division KSB1 bacterium]
MIGIVVAYNPMKKGTKSMKVGITVWQNRISPVFDVAKHVKVIRLDNNAVQIKDLEMTSSLPLQRAELLSNAGIKVLICGAISVPFAKMIAGRNIKVIPFIAGEFSTVLNAYLNSNLERPEFNMPGYRRQRRRRFHGGRPNGR